MTRIKYFLDETQTFGQEAGGSENELGYFDERENRKKLSA